jgi:ABC-2 type transport system permease protein
MPPVLQWLSHLIPLRYYLEIIRSILLKGVGAASLTQEIVALAILGALTVTGAALRFRKRLD